MLAHVRTLLRTELPLCSSTLSLSLSLSRVREAGDPAFVRDQLSFQVGAGEGRRAARQHALGDDRGDGHEVKDGVEELEHAAGVPAAERRGDTWRVVLYPNTWSADSSANSAPHTSMWQPGFSTRVLEIYILNVLQGASLKMGEQKIPLEVQKTSTRRVTRPAVRARPRGEV